MKKTVKVFDTLMFVSLILGFAGSAGAIEFNSKIEALISALLIIIGAMCWMVRSLITNYEETIEKTDRLYSFGHDSSYPAALKH